MRTALTIGIDAKGASRLIHGPEVPFTEQRASFLALTDDTAPKGMDRVEFWSPESRVKVFKVTSPSPEPSKPARSKT